MRKHHSRWVALFAATAIATSGLVGVQATASADDKQSEGLSWPVVRQGVSSYSIDGFEIGYLPAGLERYGINASSTTNGQGERHSQLSWVQGPDQLYGRVAVLRSQRVRELDDLRDSRYGHLPEKGLVRLAADGEIGREAYLSEATGDLFWMERPGVAITTHLQPERWDRGELVEMAAAVREEGGSPGTSGSSAPQEPAEAKPAEEAGQAPAEGGAPVEEPTGGPEGAAGAAGTEGAETPAAQTPGEEAPVEQAPAEEAPGEEAPAQNPQAPAEPAEPAAPQAPEAPEAPEVPEAPAAPTAGAGEVAPNEPVEGGAPAENPAATPAQTPAETPAEAPAETPAGSDLPEGVEARQVRECVIDRFVDFGTGESQVEANRTTPASGVFVEQALTKDQLSEDDRDQLLATVWEYGEADAKTAAVDACAADLGLEPAAVEGVIMQISNPTAPQESVQEPVPAADAVSGASGAQDVPAGGAGDQPVADPVDAQEWEELWVSLPWSLSSNA